MRKLEICIHLKMRLIVAIRIREIGIGLLQLLELCVDLGESLLHGLEVLIELLDNASGNQYRIVIIVIV
jgi:hypothetical protein